MLLPSRWGLVQHGVERAVFFFIFLDEMQVLAGLVGDARDSQRGQQPKFHYALTGDQRLKGDGGAAVEVIVLGDDGFDIVAMRREEALVLREFAVCACNSESRCEEYHTPSSNSPPLQLISATSSGESICGMAPTRVRMKKRKSLCGVPCM